MVVLLVLAMAAHRVKGLKRSKGMVNGTEV